MYRIFIILISYNFHFPCICIHVDYFRSFSCDFSKYLIFCWFLSLLSWNVNMIIVALNIYFIEILVKNRCIIINIDHSKLNLTGSPISHATRTILWIKIFLWSKCFISIVSIYCLSQELYISIYCLSQKLFVYSERNIYCIWFCAPAQNCLLKQNLECLTMEICNPVLYSQ